MTIPVTVVAAGRSGMAWQSEAWHEALQRAGAHSDLELYPDEDHVFGADSHRSVLDRLAESWQIRCA